MKKVKRLSLFLALILIASVLSACSGTDANMTAEQAKEKVQAFAESISLVEVSYEPDARWLMDSGSVDELPPIDRYPLSVQTTAKVEVYIHSSTEKARATKDDQGNPLDPTSLSPLTSDRWLDTMARRFNASGFTTSSGQSGGITVRPIASGDSTNYIKTRKDIPDAQTPSTPYWGEDIKASGMPVETITDRLVGNVAGIAMNPSTARTFADAYGEATIVNVDRAILAGDLRVYTTNPNSSSTGGNRIVEDLYGFDPSNPFSANAIAQFQALQALTPPVIHTTAEMVTVAVSGVADAITMESQEMAGDSRLNDWSFTPFGVRHDSPVLALDGLSGEKLEVLKAFVAFCQTSEAQQLATEQGFNRHDDYAGVPPRITGSEYRTALSVYKQNKDGGKPVASVIVFDRSGSMDLETTVDDPDLIGISKIEFAKLALTNGMNYISESNVVGMVGYSGPEDISIDVPLGRFDAKQKSLFMGAINAQKPNSSTATNDALLVALNMLLEYQKTMPDAKLRIILVTDGQQQGGRDIGAVQGPIKALGIPIISIGFEANPSDLNTFANMHEGGRVVFADSGNVIFEVAKLFDIEL